MTDFSANISEAIAQIESRRRKRKLLSRYAKPEAARELEKEYHEHRQKTSPLPVHAIPHTTFRDDTANGLTKCILAYLRLKGSFATRLNSTGIYRADLKRFVPNT